MSLVPPLGHSAPRPVLARARSPRTAARTIGIAGLLVLAVAACAPAVPTAPASYAAATTIPASPTPIAASPDASNPHSSPTHGTAATPTPTDGASGGPDLLVLAPAGDAASLHLVRMSGEVISVPLPDPTVAAVVPIADGRLLAVLRDGRSFVATRGPSGSRPAPAGMPSRSTDPARCPPGAFAWSATASPDGSRVAVIARPADAQAPSSLVVIEPDRGRREVHPLADESEGVAPAWVDAARVAIVQRDRFDRVFLAIVAVADGRTLEPIDVRAVGFATSGDGATCVALPEERVVVGPTASVLALRLLPESGPALPAGDRPSGGVALSGDGRFLALGVDSGGSGPTRLAIYERIGGAWHAGPRIALPAGASGGQPTWLP